MTRSSTTTALLRGGCVIIGPRHHARNNNTRAAVVAGRGSGSIEMNNLNFSHPHHHHHRRCWFSSPPPLLRVVEAAAAAQYISLHHHKYPSLFPPYREPGSFAYFAYHVSSAIDAIVTLLSSQEARDKFVALTSPTVASTMGGVVINSRILNQSDVGLLKSLTLYNELLHPRLQQSSKFNIREFMVGCDWALSQFHRTKDVLLPKLLTNVNVAKKSNGVEVKFEHETGGEDDNNSKKINDKELMWVKNLVRKSKAFSEVAANDPDSIEGTFVAMTTPEALNSMQLDGFTRLFSGQMVSTSDDRTEDQIQIDKLKEYYNTGGAEGKLIDDATKVMNVALLSARVEEIYPSSAEQAILLHKTKTNDDPNAPLEDESLTPPPEVDESKSQLITHLEVLYELQQSSINDEGKTKTKTLVMVGKFEGCLFGDPNGDELRWKLASYRPALEFYNTA